jgi:GT2 family glycosyltransferase
MTTTTRIRPGVPIAATPREPLSLGVLVCTYQRPADLARCLKGLAGQSRQADDIVVVCRDNDEATHAWLAGRASDDLPLRIVNVTRPGIVAARNAGHDACRTAILSSIDDDVVPHCDWLRRVELHFLSDPALGGLGGRDHVHDGEQFDERIAKTVGRLQWFGRPIGNHHLGYGQPREVRFLKGANMSYRAEAMANVRFDTRLCGRKIEAHEDLAFSFAVGRTGWKLVYDPTVLVYHYAGRPDKRAYSAISRDVAATEIYDVAFNMVIALWDGLSPVQRAAFVIWSFLIGTGVEPGLLQAIRYSRRLGFQSWRRFASTQKGRWAAYRQINAHSSARARHKTMDRRAPGAELSMSLRTEE